MKAVSHPPGRLTLPSMPLTDKQFVYTRSESTDVAMTIQRARELLIHQRLKAELREIASQALLPGVLPKQAPAQKVRAGIGQSVRLPTI